jgi:hypothetical protein
MARPRWTYSTKSNHELNEERWRQTEVFCDLFGACRIFNLAVILIKRRRKKGKGAPHTLKLFTASIRVKSM